MKKVKILLPFEGVSEKEIEQVVNSIEGASVSFDEVSNITGEILCAIVSSSLTFVSIAMELAKLKGYFLAEQNCMIIDEEGNILKSNVKIKDIAKIDVNALFG